MQVNTPYITTRYIAPFNPHQNSKKQGPHDYPHLVKEEAEV